MSIVLLYAEIFGRTEPIRGYRPALAFILACYDVKQFG